MAEIRSQKWYGWRAQIPDQRDKRYTFTDIALPAAASLDASLMPPVIDQGELGSCTGCSSSRAVMYLEAKEGQPRIEASAMFAYYNARVIEGTASSDSGASIRDVVNGIVKLGLCAESLYPYNVRRFAQKPPLKAYSDAKYSVLNSYELIDGTGDPVIAAKTAIVSGWPVEFGFTVYSAFETPLVASSGIVPLPGDNESPVGAHAVWVWQYSDARQAFLVRNSWGPDWGVEGSFWFPYLYFGNDNLCSDRWVLKSVS